MLHVPPDPSLLAVRRQADHGERGLRGAFREASGAVYLVLGTRL
jgi:hypothetical protein